MPNTPQSPSDSAERQPESAEIQPAAPLSAEASGAPPEGEFSREALEPLPPAESSRSQFRETLGRARQAIRNARDVILGTESTGGELGRVAGAAKDLAVDVSGAQLSALKQILTLHPIEAVRTEATGLIGAAGDVKDLAAASLRATAKGGGVIAKAPFKAAKALGHAAAEGTKMAGHGIAALATAPVHGAMRAGKAFWNAPLRAFDAVMNSLARVHDAILSSGRSVAAKAAPV